MSIEGPQKGRALIVDDDLEMRRMLALLLRRSGYTAELADCGEQALLLIAGSPPDVVITDLHMPGMDGVELLRKIRAIVPDMPVIVLTASGGITSAVEAMRAGAEDYLTKPVDAQALRYTVERAIEHRRQRAETDLLRRTLEELRKAHNALAAERDFVSTILDTVGALVIVTDRDDRVQTFNRTCERLSGYTEEEVMGTTALERLIPPEELPAVRSVFDALVSGQGRRNTNENHWISKDGKRHLIAWTNTVLLDDAGQVKNIVGTGLDVTEAREMAARVRRTEHLASLATFSAGVAHEIKNPLNAATLHLTLLGRLIKGKEPDIEGALDAAGIATAEIRRVATLLEEFLQFAKPQTLRRGPTDLRRICDDVAALCRLEASTANIEVAVSGESSIEAVVDEQRMRQVVLNLMRNAMEAVGQGGHVCITAKKLESNAQIAVEDDGPGLSADEVRVFQPFFTTKEKGTGLGLAITHRIVTDHGGDISVESQPGRTVFTICLPLGVPA